MPRFFIDGTADGRAYIAGADALHIAKALRMRPGEALTLCDGKGTDFDGVLETVTDRQVTVRISASRPSQAEPTLAVTLYQGLPKGDKMDWIIQKAVELGVTAVVPVATRRSVARLEGTADKKQERWQRIAAEAAGQCGRGMLPSVERPRAGDPFHPAAVGVRRPGGRLRPGGDRRDPPPRRRRRHPGSPDPAV